MGMIGKKTKTPPTKVKEAKRGSKQLGKGIRASVGDVQPVRGAATRKPDKSQGGSKGGERAGVQRPGPVPPAAGPATEPHSPFLSTPSRWRFCGKCGRLNRPGEYEDFKVVPTGGAKHPQQVKLRHRCIDKIKCNTEPT